jgi:hypothetical protein
VSNVINNANAVRGRLQRAVHRAGHLKRRSPSARPTTPTTLAKVEAVWVLASDSGTLASSGHTCQPLVKLLNSYGVDAKRSSQSPKVANDKFVLRRHHRQGCGFPQRGRIPLKTSVGTELTANSSIQAGRRRFAGSLG